MRKSAPPFLAIFRTRLQGELLALLYLRPWDAAVSISDLARELGAPIPTVHREASRLVEAGLLVEIKAGRTRLVRAPEDDLVTRPLTELLAVTFGPLPVLTEFLSRMAGVSEAYIYGSWAARYLGEPGPTPVDIDVLVVGDADADELDEIASGETAATSRGQHPPRETQAVEASRKRPISGQCRTATTRPNSARQGRQETECAGSKAGTSSNNCWPTADCRRSRPAGANRPPHRAGADPRRICPFDRMRRRRHDSEYPSVDQRAVDDQEAQDDLPKMADIIDMAERVIDQMDVF
jgi:DNA-binding transcriptional ArsR family regulator